ncbi:MAG: DUF4266 domain-containing protein [Sandaracinaceae bacterium]
MVNVGRKLATLGPLLALALIVASSLGLGAGCAIVPRYQRELVADPAMDPAADRLEARSLRKLHLAREGAQGGDGTPAGGGCACGN